MHCAQRLTLPSINWDIAIGVGFAVGLLLFGIGTSILRSLREEAAAHALLSWPALVDESLANANVQLRRDMIERLAIVNTDWSRQILERARTEERDPKILVAIETALSS